MTRLRPAAAVLAASAAAVVLTAAPASANPPRNDVGSLDTASVMLPAELRLVLADPVGMAAQSVAELGYVLQNPFAGSSAPR